MDESKQTFIVRADGGPGIGLGHLVRTGAIAAEFLKHGYRVVYATETPEYVEELCPSAVDIVELPDKTLGTFERTLDAVSPDVSLVDSYRVGTDHQSAARGHAARAGVILDDTRFTVDCDVLVNGNLYADGLSYEWEGDEPTWCLGPSYLPLRQSVRRCASQASTPPSRLESIVVTMGGTDIKNSTPSIVRALAGIDQRIDVVVGPGFSNISEIRAAADEVETTVNVVENPSDMAKLLYEADVAVSACGSTVYELLALGTPFTGVVQADNQESIGEVLEQQQLATVVREPVDMATVRDGVETLLEDSVLRQRRQREGRAVVDGKGVERIYNRLTGSTEGERQ
ncbi:UDP-2,4-diacetamido-2,4,6-trideoxy-beta-L-altropyranose hydrolase [Haloarchaeobius sp. DFWS5]|uniref:UDP-2,4-diacetamido-2,4, 6-trideoxy-beta-L-altropyranose hydrolase n=1 Tax=Haloarchaeobius sp. DFWS5 TaxID=3446114 RepID=UPI003EBA662B